MGSRWPRLSPRTRRSARRCGVCERCDRSRGGAGVHRRHARVRHWVFGRCPHVVAARVCATARLAAIAPVAGLRSPSPYAGRPIPVLSFHGLADPQNTYDGHAPGRGPEWEERVPDALASWAARNTCRPNVVLDDPPGPLSTLRYEGCAEGAEVRLIRIDGRGHTGTRRDIDTTAALWQFFKGHQLRK